MNTLNTQINEPDAHLRQTYLDAMSAVAATVNVVTTDGPAGQGGVTVTAMSSVSADKGPPLLMVCIHENSTSAKKILENEAFCVNVLGEDQRDISNSFAGRSEADRFSVGSWQQLPSGGLGLEEAVAVFDCRLRHFQLMGTHYVLFGEIQDVSSSTARMPLIYAQRDYARVR